MKLFVALTVLGLLGVSLAFETPEQVQAAITGHVETKIFNLLSTPGIGRAGGGIKCYDKYLPLITKATENSKTDTAACIERAASRRNDELNKVKQERENLNLQVQSVENTLTSCLNKTDDLEYLKCLRENSAILQSTISEVGKSSTLLADNLSASYKNIDATEDNCIKNVIAKSKSESDELLAALQNCLMNGLDSGSDGGSDGDSDNGSDGNSDAGSDGNSNGDSDNGSDGNSDAGSDGNSNGDSDNGANNGNDGDSDSDNNGNSDSDNNGESDNSNNDSDSGVIPDERQNPEEDIFP